MSPSTRSSAPPTPLKAHNFHHPNLGRLSAKCHPDFVSDPGSDMIVVSSVFHEDEVYFPYRSEYLTAASKEFQTQHDAWKAQNASEPFKWVIRESEANTRLFLDEMSLPKEGHTIEDLKTLLAFADEYKMPGLSIKTLRLMLDVDPDSAPTVFALSVDRQHVLIDKRALSLFGARKVPDDPSAPIQRGTPRKKDIKPAEHTLGEIPARLVEKLPKELMDRLRIAQEEILNHGGDWKEWVEAEEQESLWDSLVKLKEPKTPKSTPKATPKSKTPKKMKLEDELVSALQGLSMSSSPSPSPRKMATPVKATAATPRKMAGTLKSVSFMAAQA